MAKKQPVDICGIKFEKKGDALNHLKDILNTYKPEEVVSQNHAEFLLQALRRHPESKEKIGCGIKNFFVRRADFNTKCFWITRTDGTIERFSYKSCV